jgi:hypothetical protein
MRSGGKVGGMKALLLAAALALAVPATASARFAGWGCVSRAGLGFYASVPIAPVYVAPAYYPPAYYPPAYYPPAYYPPAYYPPAYYPASPYVAPQTYYPPPLYVPGVGYAPRVIGYTFPGRR